MKGGNDKMKTKKDVVDELLSELRATGGAIIIMALFYGILLITLNTPEADKVINLVGFIFILAGGMMLFGNMLQAIISLWEIR